jgi:rifampicin phosphotransferase
MQSIRRDSASVQSIRENSPAELSQLYQNGELPAALEREINRFLDQYGGRGFGEIDLGRIRWAENPTHVFEMLASFLQIEDADNTPDAVFARGVLSANQAIGQLTDIIRKTHGGMVKAVLMRFFANRARQLMGMRESPKFFAVRMMWIIHREIIKTGQEFVEAGDFDKADDLLYLTFPELLSLANHDERDWRGLITDRRAAYQRELRRRQIPRLLSSDGRAFYEGMNAPTNQGSAGIVGSPVSPGLVEGIVRVVFDPGNAHLVPGEIMVCPGTDPSWTPLFMAASGLVMEVGGMMTHGAVVAREYGIPAVVGVTKATSRLINGQRIQLNGSSGEITLLD